MPFTADVAANIDLSSDLDPLLPLVLPVLKELNATVLVELCLYGIHVVLFIICVFILVKSKKSSRPVNLVAAIIMFCLSTADIILSIRIVVQDLPLWFALDLDTLNSHAYPKGPIFVTNNLIADILLLYRCHMVWGGNRYVLFISYILLLADTVWGWVTAGRAIAAISKFSPMYLWSVFAMNIIVTTMTVSRIIWVSRKSGAFEKQHIRRYNIAIAAIVESGAIYSLCILVYLVIPLGNDSKIVFIGVIMRTVAIMPTLMIVQVALGKFTEVPDSNNRIDTTTVRHESIVLDTVRTLDMRQESGQRYSTILHNTQEPGIVVENETV